MMVSPRMGLALLCSCYVSIHGFTSPLNLVQYSLDRRIARPPAASPSSPSSPSSSSGIPPRTAGLFVAAALSPRSREGGFGGGGMGKGKSSSPKTKKKQGMSPAATASKPTLTTPFDVSASVMRHEKRYDQLLLQAAKRMARDENSQEAEDDGYYESRDRTYEFVVASRDDDVLPDWVPVAQIIVAVDPGAFRGNMGGDGGVDGAEGAGLARAAVSAHCREIHHVAGLSSNAFRSIPRQRLRYAVEPAESFYRHVYDKVVELPPAAPMSTVEARKVLQIQEGGTLHDLKLQYRRRSMECHPDRVRHQPSSSSSSASAAANSSSSEGTLNAGPSAVAADDASAEFSRVKLAYETLLGSGSMRRAGSTWYESLGGRERTEFSAVDLMSLREAADLGFGADGNIGRGVDSAVMGLDPSLVQSFVARSRASK